MQNNFFDANYSIEDLAIIPTDSTILEKSAGILSEYVKISGDSLQLRYENYVINYKYVVDSVLVLDANEKVVDGFVYSNSPSYSFNGKDFLQNLLDVGFEMNPDAICF